MAQRLWISLRRDNLINWRNFYYAVTLAVALIYLALVRWVIPTDLTVTPTIYIADQTAEGRYAAYVAEQLRTEELVGPAQLVGSMEELRASLAENQNSVGVALSPGTPLPEVTLFFQGYENPQVRNLLAVALEDSLREAYDQPWPVNREFPQQVLRGDGRSAAVPLNQMLVPFLLFSDAVLIGLFFIAALIFMEKDEGTLRAYLVAPGHIWEYLLSKALNLMLLAVIFTLLFVLATIGLGANYFYLLLLVALGSIFASLLGALIAVHFENLTQFLFPAVFVIILISLPAVVFVVPGFAPFWLRWLPTYPLVFGLREAIFPTGNPQIIVTAALTMLLLDGALLAISSWVFRRQLAHA